MQLNEDMRDELKEILNLGVGYSTATLSELIGKPVKIRLFDVSIVEASVNDYIKSAMGDSDTVYVKESYSGEVSGSSFAIFDNDTAFEVLNKMPFFDEPLTEWNEMAEQTMVEVGNGILMPCLDKLAQDIPLDLKLEYPTLHRVDDNQSATGDALLLIDSELEIEESANRVTVILSMSPESMQKFYHKVHTFFSNLMG